MDVQACFDTIEQTKLLDIIRELLSEVTVLCGIVLIGKPNRVLGYVYGATVWPY